jgi:predicted dehydrogenase
VAWAIPAGWGGCIIDMGYHLVDMLLWYFGMPDRVLAQHSASARPEQDYDAEDTATITFGYGSGLFGTALLPRCVDFPRLPCAIRRCWRWCGWSGSVTAASGPTSC